MPTTLYDRPEIEYLDGQPHPKVSARLDHGVVQLALGLVMGDCVRGRGVVGTEIRFAPSTSSAKTEFVPDVSYISNTRLRELSRDARQKPPFSPDIAAEVRSPSDDLRYLAKKIRRYLETGSLLVLDVNPETRTIQAHNIAGTRSFGEDETFMHDVAPWLQFEVKQIFADVLEDPRK